MFSYIVFVVSQRASSFAYAVTIARSTTTMIDMATSRRDGPFIQRADLSWKPLMFVSWSGSCWNSSVRWRKLHVYRFTPVELLSFYTVNERKIMRFIGVLLFSLVLSAIFQLHVSLLPILCSLRLIIFITHVIIFVSFQIRLFKSTTQSRIV